MLVVFKWAKKLLVVKTGSTKSDLQIYYLFTLTDLNINLLINVIKFFKWGPNLYSAPIFFYHSILGIKHAYISCCYVGQTSGLQHYGYQEQSLLRKNA